MRKHYHFLAVALIVFVGCGKSPDSSSSKTVVQKSGSDIIVLNPDTTPSPIPAPEVMPPVSSNPVSPSDSTTGSVYTGDFKDSVACTTWGGDGGMPNDFLALSCSFGKQPYCFKSVESSSVSDKATQLYLYRNSLGTRLALYLTRDLKIKKINLEFCTGNRLTQTIDYSLVMDSSRNVEQISIPKVMTSGSAYLKNLTQDMSVYQKIQLD